MNIQPERFVGAMVLGVVVDVFRPDAEGRFPAVLLQTPYNKDGYATRAKWFAQRGYVVVNADSRGRFDSEGEWDPFFPLHKTDGHDLVEWIAQQPWCNGRVGTYGLSYMGWSLLVWTDQRHRNIRRERREGPPGRT